MFKDLEKDIFEAMKAKDKLKIDVLRMLKAGIKQTSIDEGKEIDNEMFLSEVLKGIKTRKESLDIFEKQNRDDLADKTKEELDILEKYLPKQLTDNEAKKIIADIITKLNATSIKDMGKVMKEASAELKGSYDLKKVSELVKEKLM